MAKTKSIQAMTLIAAWQEPRLDLARYELDRGTVKLVLLNPLARELAEAPMQGLNYLPEGGKLTKILPRQGQKFFQALIQQGNRTSYYDYIVEYSDGTTLP